MDRNEILEKNKQSAPMDEGVAFHDNRARGVGVTCMVGLIALLIVYNLFKGQPSESLQAVLWAFIGTEALCKFRYSRGKAFLVAGVAGVLTALVFTVTYVLNTW
ncbi:DUF6442 family protein [Ruminococcaceae bacterium OttesenSCG-928-D13]|nr:DUF6442 family protein [Ruminococcaceae bacterium OttesenSCG-928-D13]